MDKNVVRWAKPLQLQPGATITTFNVKKNWWWTRDFFFFAETCERDNQEMTCMSWRLNESQRAVKVSIWPYFLRESNERKHMVEWHGCSSRGRHMESNEWSWRLAERRQGKRGREQHVPMHCTETFPLNETFPLKDMRSQNFVKWPLGNWKLYLKIHLTFSVQAK